MPPSAPLPCTEAATLQRLLGLRLGGRTALQRALLQALFGSDEVAALDARARRRLAALLASRDDHALEALAWQGHADRGAVSVRLDLVFDGMPGDAELRASLARLAEYLRCADWAEPALAVRAVLVCADRDALTAR